jgi:hypothetical protein
MKTIANTLADIAHAEIGNEEIDATNCGPRINEYKAATNLPPDENWPWCAAFVCWCVREAASVAGIIFTPTFKRPTTAGAWALEAWSLKQDHSTWTLKRPGRDLLPGDLVIYNFSHCGIVRTAPDDTGHFTAIEGNTNHAGSREGGAVWLKWRRSNEVRSRIRFRV